MSSPLCLSDVVGPVVIGIDPSYTSTGVAILDNATQALHTFVVGPEYKNYHEQIRMLSIVESLGEFFSLLRQRLLADRTEATILPVIEAPTSVIRNSGKQVERQRMIGAIMYCCLSTFRQYPVLVHPSSLRAVFGIKGVRDKDAVRRVLVEDCGLQLRPDSVDDEWDAAALAVIGGRLLARDRSHPSLVKIFEDNILSFPEEIN